MYPKMYLGLVWDTCKIHAKYQDTCILLECNRAFKIHLRYIRIHEGYMYPSGYTQDTSRYIRIRILITNPPKLDNKPPRSLVCRATVQSAGRLDIVSISCCHTVMHTVEQKNHGTTKKGSLEYRSKTPGGAGYTRQTHEPHKHLKTNPTLRLTRQTTPEPRNTRVATNHRSPLTRSSAVWW